MDGRTDERMDGKGNEEFQIVLGFSLLVFFFTYFFKCKNTTYIHRTYELLDSLTRSLMYITICVDIVERRGKRGNNERAQAR